MLTAELIVFLFDGKFSTLSAPMAEWLASSRRFAAFVDSFRDKIRKKIRATKDPESLLDLQLELETAYLLLGEKPLSVSYEPDHAKRLVRAPDFAVTYTTSLTFMLEVTRMRGEAAEKVTPENTNPTLSPQAMRVADTICSKLGQFQPQRPNILLIGMDAPTITASDLRAIMLYIQGRAERADSAFFKRHQFRDRTDFFAGHQRLSEILVRGPQVGLVAKWVNPQAKHPLPSKVQTILYRSHAR